MEKVPRIAIDKACGHYLPCTVDRMFSSRHFRCTVVLYLHIRRNSFSDFQKQKKTRCEEWSDKTKDTKIWSLGSKLGYKIEGEVMREDAADELEGVCIVIELTP